MFKDQNITVYYFPNYHRDVRNALTHGSGWNEWELVRQARPRFPGHLQPKVPLWGYEDESDPAVMRKKIETAANYGIDAFIFDWYYYEDGLFLERALENRFMPAAEDGRSRENRIFRFTAPNISAVPPGLSVSGQRSGKPVFRGSISI